MRKGIIICTLIILSFISMSCICAVDMNDDVVASQNSTAIDLTQIDEMSLPDERQVVGQTDNQEIISANAKGTFSELESEIQNGYGSTITLKKNYEYEGTGYSDGITINNPITIDGKGHIIDATGKARIFDIKSDNVTIKNVIFMNGKVGQNKGGAIYWQGANGNLSDCIFTNNNAIYGGAVYWDGDYGTVSNCGFSQNSGKWSDFGWGGAVYWDGAFGTVCESTFAYNFAYSIGGAVYWGGMQGTVSGCEFVGNYLTDEEDVTSSGNAIYTTGNSYSISNCVFKDNHGHGLGVVALYPYSKISGCYFVNNDARKGVIDDGQHSMINNNIFLNNKVTPFYMLYGDSDTNIDNNWFGNNATNYNIKPQISNKFTMNKWLFMNATANPDPVSSKNGSDITFKLYSYGSDGISEYDNTLLNPVVLTITPNTISFNTSEVNIGNPVHYNPMRMGIGEITATIENVACTVSFTITDGTSFYDLNKLINGNKNETIILDKDYAYNPIVDSAFKDGIVINRAVTIIGNNHTLNGVKQSRIFYIKAGGVTVKNITFINGKTAEYGGAILWFNAESGSVSDCSFVNNSAADNGGAIWWYGSPYGSVSSCSFVGNSADHGGAILLYSSPYTSVSGCSFVDNSAEYNGGAINWYYGDYSSISGCIFVNNSANNGDIYFFNEEGGNLNINNNVFLNSNVNAIVFYKEDFTSNVDYNWFGNNATNYSIKPQTSDKFTMDKWLFLNATATPDAISAFDSSDIIFKLYLYNSNSGAISDYDKAPFKNIELTVTATNGTVGPTAKLAEPIKFTSTGIWPYAVTATVEDVTQTVGINGKGDFDVLQEMVNNESLSVINLERDYIFNEFDSITDGVIITRNITINGNGHIIDAKGKSRILNVKANNVTIINVTFINGMAPPNKDGGAIYWDHADYGSVSGCSFVNNSATNRGGAIYWSNAKYSNVSDCSFVNNSATTRGGAIYWYDGDYASVSDCSFVDNSADEEGGALYLNSADYASVSGSSFVGNSADNDGGAIYWTGEYGSVSGCSFADNSADNEGGAIWWYDGPYGSVSGCIFVNNSANKGIFYFYNLDHGNLTVNNNIFLDNNVSAVDFRKEDSTSNVNYNWFGHNSTNYNVNPNLPSCTVWLFLNATATSDTLVPLETSEIIFKLYAYDSNSQGVVEYDDALFRNINLTVTSTGGSIDKRVVKLNETIKFAPTESGIATVTAQFKNVEQKFDIDVTLHDASVSVINSTLDLKIGDKFTIVATPNPADLNVTFVPDDSGVVSVDENGFVTALKGGTATIVVKVGGDGYYAENSTNVIVTVSKVFTEIILENDNFTLNALENISAGATLNPVYAGNLNYVSNDTSVARVYDGEIITVGAGTALITVSFAGNDIYEAAENKTIKITVTAIDASVNVDKKVYMLNIGEVVKIGATSIPEDLALSYEIYGDCISINENGYVTALGEGVSFVLVSVGDDVMYKYDVISVMVIVIKTPTNIIVQNTALDMKIGDEADPAASLMPSAAGNLTYTSNDTSVAIVENGVIKALAVGTATITVSFAGNEIYDAAENQTINVTVGLKDASVSVDNSTIALNVDENFTIVATTSPADLDVTYVIDDSGVVSIDGNGVVTALKEGTTSIIVKVGGDGVYAENSTVVTVKVGSGRIAISPEKAFNFTNPDLISVNLPEDATGFVMFDIDEIHSYVPLVNGKANITIPELAEGTYNVTVTYSGDDKYALISTTKEINVTNSVFKISENKNLSPLYSAKATYSVLVTKDGKAVGAGEEVTFKFNGKTYTVKTDSKGYATLNINTNVKPKAYIITAEYKGVKVSNKVTVKNIIKASNKKVKKSRKVTKVKVSLKKVNGKYLKGKVLKIKFNKKTYKVKTNKKGVATWKVKKSMLKKLKVGKKYKYKVTYGKDTVTKKLTIKK